MLEPDPIPLLRTIVEPFRRPDGLTPGDFFRMVADRTSLLVADTAEVRAARDHHAATVRAAIGGYSDWLRDEAKTADDPENKLADLLLMAWQGDDLNRMDRADPRWLPIRPPILAAGYVQAVGIPMVPLMGEIDFLCREEPADVEYLRWIGQRHPVKTIRFDGLPAMRTTGGTYLWPDCRLLPMLEEVVIPPRWVDPDGPRELRLANHLEQFGIDPNRHKVTVLSDGGFYVPERFAEVFRRLGEAMEADGFPPSVDYNFVRDQVLQELDVPRGTIDAWDERDRREAEEMRRVTTRPRGRRGPPDERPRRPRG